MTKGEQETTFHWAADADAVSVWTVHSQRPLDDREGGLPPVPREHPAQAGKPVGWFYRIPLAEFRWRTGGKRRRVPEAQRQAAREQFARARPGRAA